MMNYLPFLVFLLAIAWMIRQGYASKKKYQGNRKSNTQL
jgi:hypothetical protein